MAFEAIHHWYHLFFLLNGIGAPGVVGSFLSMLSHSHVFVLDPALTVDLDCEFYSEDYSMFNNPVVWKKTQEQERTEVNIMGNILPPFLNTGRFVVTFTNNYQHYRLRLSITGLSFEDSGNYTCDVRGTRGNILGSVTHSLIVRAPLRVVYFVTGNDTVRLGTVSERSEVVTPSSSEAREVIYVEGVPGSLRCVCLGGNPPPTVEVFKEEDSLTEDFAGSHVASVSGEVGLRTLTYRTDRWTDGLNLTRNDAGKVIRCRATVTGVAVLETTARITIYHRPVVHCLTSSADLDERNVELTCEVRSLPSLLSVYWDERSSENDTGSPPAVGRPIADYSMLVTMRSDEVIETKLLLRQASQFSFRNYSLVAENAIGRTTTSVELTRRNSATESLQILELRHRQDGRREGSKPRATDHFEYRFASSKAAYDAPMIFWYYIGVYFVAGNAILSAIDLDIAKKATSSMNMANSVKARPRPPSRYRNFRNRRQLPSMSVLRVTENGRLGEMANRTRGTELVLIAAYVDSDNNAEAARKSSNDS